MLTFPNTKTILLQNRYYNRVPAIQINRADVQQYLYLKMKGILAEI